MVIAMVENTPGVVALTDNLRVSATDARVYPPSYPPTGRVDAGDFYNLHVQGLSETDRLLANRVLDNLRTDTMVTSALPVVDIHVNNGRVTLRGNVMTDDQRRNIVNAVQRAAGAHNVVDEIRVQYPRR